MSLTKDKLINRLQTQVGLDRQESRQLVEGLLEIMKNTLVPGRRTTHLRVWKILSEAKESASREKSSN